LTEVSPPPVEVEEVEQVVTEPDLRASHSGDPTLNDNSMESFLSPTAVLVPDEEQRTTESDQSVAQTTSARDCTSLESVFYKAVN